MHLLRDSTQDNLNRNDQNKQSRIELYKRTVHKYKYKVFSNKTGLKTYGIRSGRLTEGKKRYTLNVCQKKVITKFAKKKKIINTKMFYLIERSCFYVQNRPSVTSTGSCYLR